MLQSDRGMLAGLIAAAVIVILAFGGFLIGTVDPGPAGDRMPAPIVIIPEENPSKSPVQTLPPTPVPGPAPAPIPLPPPVPAPDGQVPPPPADDGGGGGDDGGDDGGGGGDDDG